MDLRLVYESPDKRLNYYSFKGKKIVGDNFSLLGFGDNLAVLSPVSPEPPVPIMKGQIRVIRKLPASVSMSKLEVDESGEKFINLNGQKLKLVPQGQIPEEVRKRTMLMKQQMVNIGGSGSKLQLRVINNVAQASGADTLQLVKPQSVDKLTTDKDKYIPQGTKKIKVISTKLQKPVMLNQVIYTKNSAQSAVSVNPPVTSVQQDNQGDDSSSVSADCLLPVRNKGEKLLTKKNLKLLNFVKMQALNLSLKKFNNDIPTKHIVDTGVQTDKCEPEQKTFSDKIVQTDIQQNSKNLDFFDGLDLDSMLDSVGESPLISDVNFGVGPIMGKSMKFETLDNRTMNINGSGQNNIVHDTSSKQMNDITMKKKLLFFKDLRECLTYNINGNLPIHDGVLYNDIGVVKRHCIALRARKAGVNLENHDGCTPIQLAVINDAHIEIVQTLLDFGADIREADGEGNNILHLCAKFGRQQILKDILSHRLFREDVECINNFNYEGLTPLMICCISSWTAGASLLMSSGAKVNLRDQTSGRTALFHAAEAQNAEIVGILLHHRADPKIKNFFGTSPHDAMYELEDMSEAIKSLIFGKSKKRSIEAEMSPARTAKAAKSLKTFSKLQRIDNKDGVSLIVQPVKYKMENEVK